MGEVRARGGGVTDAAPAGWNWGRRRIQLRKAACQSAMGVLPATRQPLLWKWSKKAAASVCASALAGCCSAA